MKIPAIDFTIEDHLGRSEMNTRASTRMGRANIQIPPTAIAAVYGTEAERFEVYQDEIERCVPMSHCWTPSGSILVGCEKGQLLQVIQVNLTFF